MLWEQDDLTPNLPLRQIVQPPNASSRLYDTHRQLQSLRSYSNLNRAENHAENIFPSLNRSPESTCFVFYLSSTVTNEALRKLFMPYGTILNAYIARDKITNCTRGFGFVDFSTRAEAQAAVTALDKAPFEGKFLSVSIKV
jgi:RNA recognition motif-containing protein